MDCHDVGLDGGKGIVGELARRHLTIAQTYPGPRYREVYHPSNIMIDDLLMYQINSKGYLKAKNDKDFHNLYEKVRWVYLYLYYLRDQSLDIVRPSNEYVKLYRGINHVSPKDIKNRIGTEMYLPIPSSWAMSLDSATNFANKPIDGDISKRNCCLLEIKYNLHDLIGFQALPPGYCLNNHLINEEYSHESNLLEDNDIKIHNQPESEVILPACHLEINGFYVLNYKEEKFLVIQGNCTVQNDIVVLMKNLTNFYNEGKQK